MVGLAIQSDAQALAIRIRRQRQALRLSLAETAELAGVSTGFLSMLESGGTHQPGHDRLTRVASVLGLGTEFVEARAEQLQAAPDLSARLGACLAVVRKAQLAELARATRSTLAEVRAGLRDLSSELASCGMTVVDSGHQAELVPQAALGAEAARLIPPRVSLMTEARMTVLAIVAAHGAATNKLVDEIRGLDSSELLVGLLSEGYLEALQDERSVGRPYVYRLTPRVLEEIGMETVEQMRAAIRPRVDPSTVADGA